MLNTNGYYLEILLDDKIYSQRTPYSKITEFNLNGIKQKTYEELPKKIQDIIDENKYIEKNPDIFFDYEIKNKQVIIKNITRKITMPFFKIPETINGFPVITILSTVKTRTNLIDVKQIQLPETITVLQNRSFEELQNLEYINIPKNITEIPSKCFCDCHSLKYINLSNIQIIEEGAFGNCKSFKKIKLDNIKELQKNCFTRCVELEEVIINGQIKKIQRGAFETCINLSKLKLPESIIELEPYAFSDCNLNSFIAPNNLEYIQEGAFYANNLNTVKLNEKLKEVKRYSFQNNAINKIYISPNTFVSPHAFDNGVLNKMLKEKTNLER